MMSIGWLNEYKTLICKPPGSSRLVAIENPWSSSVASGLSSGPGHTLGRKPSDLSVGSGTVSKRVSAAVLVVTMLVWVSLGTRLMSVL